MALRVAEQYISAFGELAKKGNTLIMPANAGDASSMIAQAMATYKSVSQGIDNVGETGDEVVGSRDRDVRLLGSSHDGDFNSVLPPDATSPLEAYEREVDAKDRKDT